MWTYSNPVSIYAGKGSLCTLKKLLRHKRYGIVTYKSDYFSAICAEIADTVGKEAIHIIDGVEENPSIASLRVLCDEVTGLTTKPDVWIALGGGSAIDTCKVLCAGSGDFNKVHRFILGEGEIENPTEFICIPTTSGTGSEVTCWATVWDPDNEKKYSLSDTSLYATAAILEPRLTRFLPRSITISSGLDALSHAMESLWNINRNPVSSLYAIEAIQELMTYLPKLAVDMNNLIAREKVQIAATLAGLAFSNTKTSIAHSISYAVTLEKGLSHGIACSFTLPAILRANSNDPFIQSCIERALSLSCDEAADTLENILKQLDISMLPSCYGYKQNEWNTLIDHAAAGERGKNYIGNIERLKNHFNVMYENSEEALCL